MPDASRAGTVLHSLDRHGAADGRRRSGRGDRGIGRDRSPAPQPERAGASAPLLPLRRDLDPCRAVYGGARPALSLVLGRQPERRRDAAGDDRPPHPGNRSGAARSPRAPVPGLPRVVDAPSRRALHGGRSSRAPGVSRLRAYPRCGTRLPRLSPGGAARRVARPALSEDASAVGRSCGSWLRRPREAQAPGPSGRGSRSAPCQASRRRSRD